MNETDNGKSFEEMFQDAIDGINDRRRKHEEPVNLPHCGCGCGNVASHDENTVLEGVVLQPGDPGYEINQRRNEYV